MSEQPNDEHELTEPQRNFIDLVEQYVPGGDDMELSIEGSRFTFPADHMEVTHAITDDGEGGEIRSHIIAFSYIDKKPERVPIMELLHIQGGPGGLLGKFKLTLGGITEIEDYDDYGQIDTMVKAILQAEAGGHLHRIDRDIDPEE